MIVGRIDAWTPTLSREAKVGMLVPVGSRGRPHSTSPNAIRRPEQVSKPAPCYRPAMYSDPSLRLRVSLVSTVLNEVELLDRWLESIRRQTLQPDEIVIVDAGSSDGTIESLESAAASMSMPIRVVGVPGANISQGRNRAIEEAAHDVIAATDAGTQLDEDWLESLVRPFVDPTVDVSSGFYRPAGRNDFERVLASVLVPRLSEIDADTFLPSSRSVAFRRTAWQRAGGYPEWLLVGEDLVFDMNMRNADAKFVFTPEAMASWYPRPTLKAFFKQYRMYARGDGHARILGHRHVIRYSAYASGAFLLWVGRTARWPWIALALGGAGYMRKFAWRFWDERPFATRKMIMLTPLVPLVVVVGDVGKMLGYPQGRWERLRLGGPSGLERAKIKSHRSLDQLDDLSKRLPKDREAGATA
jgi:glycosyltransferase involved in cell wall biosynthesis